MKVPALLWRSIAVACVACIVLANPAAAAAPADQGTAEVAPIELLGAQFILLDAADSVKSAPDNVVPLVEGQRYGWFVKIRTARKQVHWREEFTLPEAPKTWGEAETAGTRKLSTDSRTSVTERVVDTSKGVLLNVWAVAKGDPPGKYRIRVFVEDKLVSTFDFELR